MKRKLRIAQIAPLWFSIPPKKYGGIERIISFLTEELVRRGHKVTLFASGDSKTKAKLISITVKNLVSRGIPWHDWMWNTLNHSIAFEMADHFDIIHAHWGFQAAFFQKFTKTPIVHTLHNIPQAKDHRWEILAHYRDTFNGVFISQSEKRNCPIKWRNNWVIYNGIDISQFHFNPNPKDHFIWISRIDPFKGIENAIRAAKRAGIKLLLAGRLDPAREEYFNAKIKPHLSKQIQYVGYLAQAELAEFYSQARACLYPIEWEEPFGLIMVESMACGTPVVAFDRGSAREVVYDGKTGFVVPFTNPKGGKNIEGLVQAIKKVDQIQREDCRGWVEKKFHYQRMAQDYEKVYEQILSSR